MILCAKQRREAVANFCRMCVQQVIVGSCWALRTIPNGLQKYFISKQFLPVLLMHVNDEVIFVKCRIWKSYMFQNVACRKGVALACFRIFI